MIGIARGFEEMGIEIYATSGTCDALTAAGIECKRVNRVSQAHPNILDMIQSGTVDLIINTPTKGRKHDSDGFQHPPLRRGALRGLRHRHRHRPGHSHRPGAEPQRGPDPHRHHQNLTQTCSGRGKLPLPA